VPNILKLTADDVDDLLNIGAYGVGALIRVQSAADVAGPFADVAGVGSTPTVPLVAATRLYTAFDPDGTSASWYRTRFENVGATRISDWSVPFQVGDSNSTAIGTYADVANVKTRLAITNATDDVRLQRFCDFVNAWIESKTSRILAPVASGGPFLFDGYDALERGSLLVINQGIRAITTLEVATTTGSAFNVVPPTDYFLRPTAQERDPGWPATELWMTDVPSAGNATPFFSPGFANIRISGPAGGTLGWAREPDEIVGLAEKLVVEGWQSRLSGEKNRQGDADFGAAIRSVLDGRDYHLLGRYTVKSIEII
jgi:hypothetical protein